MTPRKSRGYALILALALLATTSFAMIGSRLALSANSSDVRAQRQTQRALREAETALIGYAAMEDNTPGTLPCPAPDVDGKSQTLCTNGAATTTFNRLPWHRLGMVAPRDGDGQCIWYALSLTHRNQPTYTERNGNSSGTPAINPASPGALSLDANPGAVAVLLSPGLTLSEQAGLRSPASNGIDCDSGIRAAFFEGSNATSGTSFINSPTGGGNDRARAIPPHKVLRPVLRRALYAFAPASVRSELQQRMAAMPSPIGPLSMLRDYNNAQHDFDKLLHPAAPDAGGACPTSIAKHPVGWLCVNGWYQHIRYSVPDNTLTTSVNNGASGYYTCRLHLSDGSLTCHNT